MGALVRVRVRVPHRLEQQNHGAILNLVQIDLARAPLVDLMRLDVKRAPRNAIVWFMES